MCYMLLLGTDAPDDLSEKNTDLMIFERKLPGLPEEALLELPSKWFVGSAHGCSCGFRHLCPPSVSLGFRVPEAWYPEEPEDIEATLQFIGVVRLLVESGYKVECIDAWCGESDSANLTDVIQVNLEKVKDDTFCFFENHRFVFLAEPNPSFKRTP